MLESEASLVPVVKSLLFLLEVLVPQAVWVLQQLSLPLFPLQAALVGSCAPQALSRRFPS